MCDIDQDAPGVVLLGPGRHGTSTNHAGRVLIAPDIDSGVVVGVRWIGGYGLYHLDAGKQGKARVALQQAFKGMSINQCWVFGKSAGLRLVLPQLDTLKPRTHISSGRGVVRMTAARIVAHEGAQCITEMQFK